MLALIIAPVLSVLAWWAAGNLGAKPPSAALPDNNYPLLEKSGCRWAGGACQLVNGEFVLELSLAKAAVPTLRVHASHSLDAMLVNVGPDLHVDPLPMKLVAGQADGRLWQLVLSQPPEHGSRIRLAAMARGSVWYGEASVAFLQANPLLE